MLALCKSCQDYGSILEEELHYPKLRPGNFRLEACLQVRSSSSPSIFYDSDLNIQVALKMLYGQKDAPMHIQICRGICSYRPLGAQHLNGT